VLFGSWRRCRGGGCGTHCTLCNVRGSAGGANGDGGCVSVGWRGDACTSRPIRGSVCVVGGCCVLGALALVCGAGPLDWIGLAWHRGRK